MNRALALSVAASLSISSSACKKNHPDNETSKPQHDIPHREPDAIDTGDGAESMLREITAISQLGKLDWTEIEAEAENDYSKFLKRIEAGNEAFDDEPELRDEYFNRCVHAARNLDQATVIDLVEKYGKGEGKKLAYANLFGTHSQKPEKLGSFAEQLPHGESRVAGLERYYLEKVNSVDEYQRALYELAETSDRKDRLGIALGLSVAGDKLLNGSHATPEQLNRLAEEMIGSAAIQEEFQNLLMKR